MQQLLGTTLAPEGITSELVERYLTALGCEMTPIDADAYEVKLPSWRLDLAREIDLIEEVARVYGYNRFANTLPVPAEVIPHSTARAESAVRARSFQLGFSEAISSTFASAAESALFAADTLAVELANPLNKEAANLRNSLLPGMVTMLGQNLSRDVASVRLFEAGAVFAKSADEVKERASLALGLTARVQATPIHSAEDAPFFELKGSIESLLGLFAAGEVTFSTKDVPAAYETGRGALVLSNGTPVASFGQLASSEASRRKLRQPVYLAEVKLEELLALPLKHTTAHEVSRFQAVERDFSFTFVDTTTWQTIAAAIMGLGIAELKTVTVEEVFRDSKKMPGRYSILVRTVFQSPEQTLGEAELTAWSGAIMHALQALGGVLRS